jgi:hypothetical protein
MVASPSAGLVPHARLWVLPGDRDVIDSRAHQRDIPVIEVEILGWRVTSRHSIRPYDDLADHTEPEMRIILSGLMSLDGDGQRS